MKISSTQLKGNSILDFSWGNSIGDLFLALVLVTPDITITINFHFELNEWDQNSFAFVDPFISSKGVNPSNQTFLHPSKNVSNPLKSKIEKNLLHLLKHGRGAAYDSIPWVRYISDPSIKCHKAIPAS